MKITDIKQQVKRQGRYSIFADSKYVFSLSENELMTSGIRIGREYTPQEFEDLKQTAVEDKAYMRAIDLLSRRMRSEWELRDYLKRKEYEPPIVDKILNMLSDKGYVDDFKFAEAWVRNRRLLKATSQRKLSMELKQKHVAEDVIAAALSGDETNEQDVLKGVIAKKRTQTRYQDEQKLMAYLLRQGFNYGDIKDALDQE